MIYRKIFTSEFVGGDEEETCLNIFTYLFNTIPTIDGVTLYEDHVTGVSTLVDKYFIIRLTVKDMDVYYKFMNSINSSSQYQIGIFFGKNVSNLFVYSQPLSITYLYSYSQNLCIGFLITDKCIMLGTKSYSVDQYAFPIQVGILTTKSGIGYLINNTGSLYNYSDEQKFGNVKNIINMYGINELNKVVMQTAIPLTTTYYCIDDDFFDGVYSFVSKGASVQEGSNFSFSTTSDKMGIINNKKYVTNNAGLLEVD